MTALLFGGAVIISNGEIIGMHVETVNQARERLGRSNTVSNRLDDVEQSVDSLIRGLSSGSIGVKAVLFSQLVYPFFLLGIL